MDDTLSAETRQILEIETTCEHVLKQCDKMRSDIMKYSKDAPSDLTNLKNFLESFAEVQRQISGLSTAAQQIGSLVPSDDFDVDEVLDKFMKKIKECKDMESLDEDVQRAISEVDEYISRSQKSAAEALDDDLFITETTDVLIDPLTKRQIQDPVKNRFCNHSFERSSILQYLERPKRCPYTGCSQILRRDDLIDDIELKAKLLNYQNGSLDISQ